MGERYGFLGSKQKHKKERSSSSAYRLLLCNCKLDVLSPNKGAPRSIRDAPPAHYILKIRSFSVLKQDYRSAVFDAGGYKWNLCFYPKGKKHEKGGYHISLYLVMADSNSFSLGWEVKASLRFSVFDQIRGKYLTAEVHGRRFNEIKKEWGFDQFISLKTFKKCSNGYLVNDECVFGVEVFDVEDRHTGRGEYLLMKKELVRRINLFPEGKDDAKGNSISLYLDLTNSSDHPAGFKVNLYCCLRVIDQINGINRSHTGSEWFSETNRSWGFQNFMPLTEFSNPEKGFLVKDTCTVEVEVAIMGKANIFA
ncbi:hypothetical protein NE237_026850 [Protea cynaroides]|uniref:MATH domain-containing protein n=1 Tax=Protea cynaroides TaxID=273540 RepID=A0A9Q0GP14_9MAGN|nr:hypothetical protein NE237_026850 [Protea cynaroides]